MADQSETSGAVDPTRRTVQGTGQQVLHSLEEIPASVGQVSRGIFGAVSRRDHTSWKSRKPTEPGYWCGRLDSAIGERISSSPVRSIAMCLGMGVIAGLCVKSRR
ncbi:hypothetical protein JIN84_00200 [Luteolibacter yonseiensis]|uniref:Uncharacterized protein n=1 Tax=Luteolibacter yonseiensis TaxID=1144680 RepID=A0A934V5K1_9BACT|nr:hypothetical protein [Luteolibacter yonseiensis]MBK1814027.1 hypothetical protein [Luteolibacter yonseiensis]